MKFYQVTKVIQHSWAVPLLRKVRKTGVKSFCNLLFLPTMSLASKFTKPFTDSREV